MDCGELLEGMLLLIGVFIVCQRCLLGLRRDGTFVYPAAQCMFEGSVAASRVAYLQAFCYLGSITLVLSFLASLRKVVMEGINCLS